MDDPVRRIPRSADTDVEPLLGREWLVSNGLGGYASGTVAGAVTRRYHGLLIAALPAPLGRCVMLNHLLEQLRLPDGTRVQLGGDERDVDDVQIPGAGTLAEFRLELGLPVWRYELGDVVLEKRLWMPFQQNTVHISYEVLRAGGATRLDLRPSMRFRPHEARVSDPYPGDYALIAMDDRFEVVARGDLVLPPLRLRVDGQRGYLTYDGGGVRDVFYRIEASRGYESRGVLWSPGFFRVVLQPGERATLIASTEPWTLIQALRPGVALDAERHRRRRLIGLAHPAARTGHAAELVTAADAYLIRPVGRVEDATLAQANGDEVRSVIAGYHWFTDWGRDTMIGLEGLTLATGRPREAGFILRMFARHVRDGLIPNFFPERESEGVYHTADATLWFFHALHRYVRQTNDRGTLRLLLPTLQDIVEHHLHGTRFGIGVDLRDGLLRQGAPGYQLTWMDAKVDDWVVTPRRGKAVEINALWYNALRLLEDWVREEQGDAAARDYGGHAERARRAFHERFWIPSAGHLHDVVDGEHGDDPACRPNQVFAISLDYPVLARDRWEPVLQVVRDRLLTPVGLRSLAPGHPDYKPRYDGDLRSRDAAYHQGTVWGWLIGPFIDAWLKAFPDDRGFARRTLAGFEPHLSEGGMGQISEIFDAEPPFTPRGCIAQAWSIAEVLRAWIQTAE